MAQDRRGSKNKGKKKGKPKGETEIPTGLGGALDWVIKRLPGRWQDVVGWVAAIAILTFACSKLWAHVEWRFHRIRFYVTVVNTRGDIVSLSSQGEFSTYEGQDSQRRLALGKDIFKISSSGSDSSDDIVLQPWETATMLFRIKNTKELWRMYKDRNAELALTLFPSEGDGKFELGRIPFDRKTLGSEKPVFPFSLVDEEAPWRSPCIEVCFSMLEDEIDPNCHESVEKMIGLLGRNTQRTGWFEKIACEEFEQYEKEIAPRVKALESLKLTDGRGSAPALDDKDCRTVAQVAVGCKRSGPNFTWVLQLSDAQKRISKEKIRDEKHRRWVKPSGATLDWKTAQEILRAVRSRIVTYYPIRGAIIETTEISGTEEEGSYTEAVLNVGSLMGVDEGMEFDVLSKGTDISIGTIKIRTVSVGEECRGELDTRYGISEGFRVISSKKYKE